MPLLRLLISNIAPRLVSSAMGQVNEIARAANDKGGFAVVQN